ncbi:MAG: hypothetical protein KC910_28735, partial [Candidatus Eremiobacteraeota bacterium]|nr:hypothetical protein [Candidatus Eremiobacteraeota bacterium]
EDVLPFLTQRLRHYMEHQRDDGFTLAKALRDDGEIIKGWFYWVIRYDVTRDVVSYISTDYYCYSCSADIFGLSPQELVLLKPYVQNGA